MVNDMKALVANDKYVNKAREVRGDWPIVYSSEVSAGRDIAAVEPNNYTAKYNVVWRIDLKKIKESEDGKTVRVTAKPNGEWFLSGVPPESIEVIVLK